MRFLLTLTFLFCLLSFAFLLSLLLQLLIDIYSTAKRLFALEVAGSSMEALYSRLTHTHINITQ